MEALPVTQMTSLGSHLQLGQAKDLVTGRYGFDSWTPLEELSLLGLDLLMILITHRKVWA